MDGVHILWRYCKVGRGMNKHGWKLYVYYRVLEDQLITSIMEPEHLVAIRKYYKVKNPLPIFYIGEL